MATTTNFGWETPDDTDLVKDGAAAMRTLGNAIDTSLVDLKGGTTGQILSKASNTDLDYTWINNDQGDITGVTAGTGISGGGTSGDVTITNSMATAIDAKGDLIAGTGADTFSRLAVGSNTQILMADSTAATGLKWAGDWTTWTPTIGGITVGNGSVAGRYFQTGKTVVFSFRLVFGSTSSITGTPSMTLPVAPLTTQFFTTGEIEDNGVTRYAVLGQVVGGSTTCYLYVGKTDGTYFNGQLISSTVPMTWTTNDVYTICGTYEVQ